MQDLFKNWNMLRDRPERIAENNDQTPSGRLRKDQSEASTYKCDVGVFRGHKAVRMDLWSCENVQVDLKGMQPCNICDAGTHLDTSVWWER